MPSATLAAGFLLLGPETLYPAHAHAAEELYVPLAGVAAWMRGEDGFAPRPVGEAIHHPPWIPHAMRHVRTRRGPRRRRTLPIAERRRMA